VRRHADKDAASNKGVRRPFDPVNRFG